MELWIRSQDKKLLEKINSFEIVDESTIQANGFPYGTYKDKERALEVLDEIQDILNPTSLKGSIINASQINIYVYEMPKE